MNFVNNSSNFNLNSTKKSKREYLLELIILADSVNVEILSDYINSRTSLKVKCKICNLEWDIRPTAIKGRRGKNWKGCQNCGKSRVDLERISRNYKRIKKQTKLLNEITEAKNIEILSEYINAKILINLKCKRCRYKWSSRPENIKGSPNRPWGGCPKCNRGRKADSSKSLEKKFGKESRTKQAITAKAIEHRTKKLKELKEIAERKYIEVISNYINIKIPVKIRCKKCSYKWLALPSTIKGKASQPWVGCPECRKKSNPLRTSHQTPEDKKKEFNKIKCRLNLQNVDVLSDYINNKTPLKLKCNNCKHMWSSQPRSILRRKDIICPKCKLIKRKKEFFKKAQKVALERGGKLLSAEYINSYTTLKWKCDICNSIWKSSYENVVNKKSWCQNCSDMLSERICRKIFEIIFNKEFPKKIFDWLLYKNKNIMHLDGYNSDLNLGFEYNGEQHYKFVPRWHKTIKGFEERKKRDKIKKKLCKEFGIILIVVPYWIAYDKMEDFIKKNCANKGLKVPKQMSRINVKKLEKTIRQQIYTAENNHK